jgi:hypothetical protein
VVPALTDGGAGGAGTATGSSGADPHGGASGSGTRTGKDPKNGNDLPAPGDTAAPDPNWFDASGLAGLLGVGSPAAAGDAAPSDAAPTATSDESALAATPAGTHHPSAAALGLLGLSLLLLLALAGGVAARWWAGRAGRYWPA